VATKIVFLISPYLRTLPDPVNIANKLNPLMHFNLKKLTKKQVNVVTSSEFTQNSQKPKNAKTRRETAEGKKN
jgi:hypothetical protein